MADLVLDLGRQGQLAPERRRAEDPLALRQDAHQLRVGVHLDEAQHAGPVLVGHPVVRLDLATVRDVRLEGGISFVVRERLVVVRQAEALRRREDRVERKRVGHRG